ncbi:MAG: adenosylcobinamide-GDP ribazoletransferase [Pseudoalteromonas spongiae]
MLFLYGMSLLQLIALIVTCFAVRSVLIAWFKKHINGYTGDCLGAAQQIFEVLIYCLVLLFLE